MSSLEVKTLLDDLLGGRPSARFTFASELWSDLLEYLEPNGVRIPHSL